jgi:hypothetical protein
MQIGISCPLLTVAFWERLWRVPVLPLYSHDSSNTHWPVLTATGAMPQGALPQGLPGSTALKRSVYGEVLSPDEVARAEYACLGHKYRVLASQL